MIKVTCKVSPASYWPFNLGTTPVHPRGIKNFVKNVHRGKMHCGREPSSCSISLKLSFSFAFKGASKWRPHKWCAPCGADWAISLTSSETKNATDEVGLLFKRLLEPTVFGGRITKSVFWTCNLTTIVWGRWRFGINLVNQPGALLKQLIPWRHALKNQQQPFKQGYEPQTLDLVGEKPSTAMPRYRHTNGPEKNTLLWPIV